ncbi:hypothetical protein BD560DRAFT_400119 [Blakeslea trispora]|nr:hypothetical protein BD560DRAFT_400119 [Blakeslea trispora]
MAQQLNEKDNDNHNDEISSDIRHGSASSSYTGKALMQPKQAYLTHNKKESSDEKILRKHASITTTRQISMSTLSLDVQPQIITKEASYSFIWIDDHYKSISNLDQLGQEKSLSKKASQTSFSARGLCNVFTICFILAIILLLFLYPFITMFLNK